MSYDVLTQRFVHEGGTKEYQLTSIRNDEIGVAYTIMRWGKIGKLIGNKVVRDDTRSGFHKEQANRLKRGYVADKTARPMKLSTGNWTLSMADNVCVDWPEDWALMKAKINRGPSPEELQDTPVDELMEHPDERAKRVAAKLGPKLKKPAPSPETTTEDNPLYGAF